jgi:hypothetical protein
MVWYLIAGARSMEWETGSRCISDVVPTLLELLQKFDSILHMAKMSAISGVSDPGLSSYKLSVAPVLAPTILYIDLVGMSFYSCAEVELHATFFF